MWTQTPDGELMDRSVVERLGQMAIRAGAADYRVFPVEPEDSSAIPVGTAGEMGRVFAELGDVDRYRAVLESADGVPLSVAPAPSAEKERHRVK